METPQKQILAKLEEAINNQALKYVDKTLAPKNGNMRGYLCSVDGCERPAYAKKFCNAHYIRARNGDDIFAPIRYRVRKSFCQICNNPVDGKGGWGLCKKHYSSIRWKTLKKTLVDLLGGKCRKCNGVFPLAVYDFHHLGDKDYSVTQLICGGSLERIAEESAKCVLLCANCHRIEHYGKEDDGTVQ